MNAADNEEADKHRARAETTSPEFGISRLLLLNGTGLCLAARLSWARTSRSQGFFIPEHREFVK